MPYDARDIANFFIDRAKHDRISLTHMSLQKILYFAHAWYLVKFDQPLVGQPFEAWKHGPVVRVVYDQLKRCKSAPIEHRLVRIDVQSGTMKEANHTFTESEKSFLQTTFSYYSRFHAYKLSDLSHEKDGPWGKTWESAQNRAHLGMIISNDLIKSWFEESGGMLGEGGANKTVN